MSIATRTRSLMRERLGYLEGGSETLLQALKAFIESHGGEVRLACPVAKVRLQDGRVLITGGRNALPGAVLKSAELYNGP